MFNFIKQRKIWYIISIALAAISIVALFVFGLRVGIDYRGGALLNISSSNPSFKSNIESALKTRRFDTFQINPGETSSYTIKIGDISNQDKNLLIDEIKKTTPDVKEISFDSIGPVVGKDLTNKSIMAVILASIAIILFVAYSFRRIPKPLSSWKFGALAVLALLHDLLITTGFVAILSHFFIWMEIDMLFITALLTIMGFSVHDTIVIYDRLRENFIKNHHKSIEAVAEESVNQTLARSINTSLTTIIVLLALLLLGGAPIRHFILILIFGIFIGTYSSIFVAAPLVVSWHKNITNKS